jgi:hypothetical protein
MPTRINPNQEAALFLCDASGLESAEQAPLERNIINDAGRSVFES